MKEFLSKYTAQIVLSSLIILIFTSCIETEQNIFYKNGWYHYDCRFSIDKSLGLLLGEEEGPFADIDEEAQDLRGEFQDYGNEIKVDIRKIDDYTMDMAISVYKWPTNQILRDLLPKTEHTTLKIPLVTNLFAYMAIQEIFQDSQQNESDKAMGELLLSDCYWTIYVEENMIPYGASKAYIADEEEWERTRVDCQWFGNRLVIKIPMAEFIDEANYTSLVIY